MSVHFTSSERMDAVEAASVQAVVCSPPYWTIKDYGHEAQIGHGESYDQYHERLDAVWRECHRALRPDGTMWIVIDKVWSSGEVVPIPYDIARRCQRVGFRLLDLVTWNKPTAIAGMTTRNSVNKHETVIVLGKGTSPKLRGNAMPDLWRVVVKAGSIRRTPEHEAPYPEELIERIVERATDPGDLVLDPFLGSGTTMAVALRMGRRCVGYEINEAYRAMIEGRVGEAAAPETDGRHAGTRKKSARPPGSGG